MSAIDLILDHQLKWCVLVPISVAMVLVGLLCENLTFLLAPNPKIYPFRLARERDFYKRSQNFRQNVSVLTLDEFDTRSNSLVRDLRSDKYLSEPNRSNSVTNPFTDPGTSDTLFNMAKGNIMSFVPQTLIMAWVNFFFADSVVMKVPFPLTSGFKSMLQSGVNTPDLDVRYVSAISWYFVNLLGLRPVYSAIKSDPNAAQELMNNQLLQHRQNMADLGAQKGEKLFSSEAESIQILTHETVFDGIASRVLIQYNK